LRSIAFLEVGNLDLWPPGCSELVQWEVWQAEIATALRQAGIPGSGPKGAISATVHATVGLILAEKWDSLIYSCRLDVRRLLFDTTCPVQLHAMQFFPWVWSRYGFGYVPKAKPEIIRGEVMKLVAELVKEWRETHPAATDQQQTA
jgi:hypothetical protein